jgi:hypothetical protein
MTLYLYTRLQKVNFDQINADVTNRLSDSAPTSFFLNLIIKEIKINKGMGGGGHLRPSSTYAYLQFHLLHGKTTIVSTMFGTTVLL